MPNLNSLSPFAFKLLCIVAAVALSHFGLMTTILGQLFTIAIGGGAVSAAISAWQAQPAEDASIVKIRSTLDGGLGGILAQVEGFVASHKAQVDAVTAALAAGDKSASVQVKS